MLLRFGCENFRSFREYQEISLVASSLKDTGPDLFDEIAGRHTVLPVAIIYGANASGKSNVLLAIRAMNQLVISSHRTLEPDQKIGRKYFALDLSSSDSNSRFDCDFVIDNVRYHYGFEFDDNEFIEEWLYAYEGGHRRNWFYRERKQFTFGKYLKGQNRVIADLTRPNSLFVSAAHQNNHEQIGPVYRFLAGMRFNMNSSKARLLRYFEQKEGMREKVLSFLKNADTGICEAKLQYEEPDQKTMELTTQLLGVFAKTFDGDPEMVNRMASSQAKARPFLELGHLGEDEKSVFIPLEDESRGTLRALELGFDVFDVLTNGGVLIVDELESSLHTLLAIELIKAFSSQGKHKVKAQLICTTHDTNLLCSDVLRRDQIWFTEKDREGQTHLYPLTTIKTRNTDNLEKGYLQGRFGAVPFYGSISNLFIDAHV